MSEKSELSILLKTLQKGLKDGNIKKLNDKLSSSLEDWTSSDKSDEIHKTLMIVCQEFSISMRNLIHSTSRGIIQDARAICVCLLHYNSFLTIRYISKVVFKKKWHTFATNAISRHKSMNEAKKMDKQYKERYEKIRDLINTKTK